MQGEADSSQNSPTPRPPALLDWLKQVQRPLAEHEPLLEQMLVDPGALQRLRSQYRPVVPNWLVPDAQSQYSSSTKPLVPVRGRARHTGQLLLSSTLLQMLLDPGLMQ